jgi:hypothetical protein
MTDASAIVMQATAVAIGGRALLIEGPPGSGKSSLALALIDDGGHLIGDDAVTLFSQDGRLIASPPPNIAGLLEVRGVGLIRVHVALPAPTALILTLGGTAAERLPGALPRRKIAGVAVPALAFDPGAIAPAARARAALALHGITFEDASLSAAPAQNAAP